LEEGKSPRELLYSRLIEVLGPDEANTLMQHLPAFEMPDLATRTEFNQLGQRMDGLENRMDGLENRMDGLENRMAGLENRMDTIERRLERVEDRLNTVSEQLGHVSDRLDKYSRNTTTAIIGAVVGLAAVVISSQLWLISLI